MRIDLESLTRDHLLDYEMPRGKLVTSCWVYTFALDPLRCNIKSVARQNDTSYISISCKKHKFSQELY